MAVLNVLVDRDTDQVWEVLSDGWTYADWVVGTQHILDVDAHWPEEGAQLSYEVRIGRFTITDVTTVRHVEPGRRLELEANAGKAGSARVSISLLPWGDERTIVVIDEHPLTGPGAWWHTVMTDALLRLRNHRMVRELARVVHERESP